MAGVRKDDNMKIFGPIPSRRLGRSLGINNIPAKTCSYSCVYCQIGRTKKMSAKREAFYSPAALAAEVRGKIEKVEGGGEGIDYLTFVPDGEPTLDVNMGKEIRKLVGEGINIAVITNASLVSMKDVREDLSYADWVSLKNDAACIEVWRRINRPARGLDLDAIRDGQVEFAGSFKGKLCTETMLVGGVNDSEEELSGIARFIERLEPAVSYILVPTRPPAEKWVCPPEESVINMAYQIFSERLERVECMIGYEGNAFSCTGDVEKDLLSITAVHPMREDAVNELISKAGAGWADVEKLINEKKLAELEYRGHRFYIRKFKLYPKIRGE